MSNEFVVVQEGVGSSCARRKTPGVLVLSEFAGAAQSLAGALTVNPWDLDGTVATVVRALTMGDVERTLRHERNFRFIQAHTSRAWAAGLVTQMTALADARDDRAAAAAAATAAATETELEKAGGGGEGRKD